MGLPEGGGRVTNYDVPVIEPVLGPDPEVRQRGFILAEEDALKQKLSGLTVTNLRLPDQRLPVSIWFRNPASVTEKSYPFITIDLVDIVFAADRAHDLNLIDVDEWPSTWESFEDSPDGFDAKATRYLPYNLFFQIATHCRSAQHDRELTSVLMTTNYLPFRFGWLEVHADNTVRHLELVTWQQADISEDPQATKRLFRKVYTIRVTAFLPPEWPLPFGTVEEVIGVIKTINGNGVLDETWHHAVEEPAGP